MKKHPHGLRSFIFCSFLLSVTFYSTISSTPELDQVQGLLTTIKAKLVKLLNEVNNLSTSTQKKETLEEKLKKKTTPELMKKLMYFYRKNQTLEKEILNNIQKIQDLITTIDKHSPQSKQLEKILTDGVTHYTQTLNSAKDTMNYSQTPEDFEKARSLENDQKLQTLILNEFNRLKKFRTFLEEFKDELATAQKEVRKVNDLVTDDMKKNSEAEKDLEEFITNPTNENLNKIEKAAQDWALQEHHLTNKKALQDSREEEELKKLRPKNKDLADAFDQKTQKITLETGIGSKAQNPDDLKDNAEKLIKENQSNFKQLLLMLPENLFNQIEELINEGKFPELKSDYEKEEKERKKIDNLVDKNNNAQKQALDTLSNTAPNNITDLMKQLGQPIANFFDVLLDIKISDLNTWLTNLNPETDPQSEKLIINLASEENLKKIHTALKETPTKAAAIIVAIKITKKEIEKGKLTQVEENKKLAKLGEDLNKIIEKITNFSIIPSDNEFKKNIEGTTKRPLLSFDEANTFYATFVEKLKKGTLKDWKKILKLVKQKQTGGVELTTKIERANNLITLIMKFEKINPTNDQATFNNINNIVIPALNASPLKKQPGRKKAPSKKQPGHKKVTK